MRTRMIFLFVALFMSINAFSNDDRAKAFVLVHGSWHGEWTWFQLEFLLRQEGYKTITVNLPGHGLDTTKAGSITLDDYRDAVVEVLDQQNRPVILVGHSMGGIVISEAAEERPEKVDKLVYVAGFLLQNGESLLSMSNQDTNSMIQENLIINREMGYADLNRKKINRIFYKESADNYAILSHKLLTQEPLAPLDTPLTITLNRFGSVPRYYIKTLKDRAITKKAQKKMYENLPCQKVYEIDTDHSPFFSATEELKNILVEIEKDTVNEPIKYNSLVVPLAGNLE